jgi:hypothetical protein
VLRVVSGIRLVRDPLEDGVGHRRGIGVDLDVAVQVAAVVVVRRPGLVRDVLVVDGFALGQPGELGCALPESAVQPGDDLGEALSGDRVVLTPGPVPLLERMGARQ